MPINPRALCPDCHLPLPRCFCPWVVALDNPTNVVILQHPGEAKHAKNTALFLAACLSACAIWPGEEFGETLAERLIQLPNPCLLYPDNQSLKQTPEQSAAVTDNIGSLIVIDATWRKSLKMLHLNPVLSTLPRLSLPAPEARLYKIRKARNPHQLSTFEASCYALGHIEHNASYYQPGLAAFDRYMRQLASYRPQHPTGETPANLRDAND